MILFFY